jgi:hypothetical protein
MLETIKVVREIKRVNKGNPQKISLMIGRLQSLRDTSPESINPDLFLFGIATGLEKICDYRVYDLHNDDRLNELNTKIKEIQGREGLDDDEYFVRRDPDTPEDYQALIERFADKWDWGRLSQNKSLPWSEALIERYADEWSWPSFSKNESLPWSETLIERYADKWDWQYFKLYKGPINLFNNWTKQEISTALRMIRSAQNDGDLY